LILIFVLKTHNASALFIIIYTPQKNNYFQNTFYRNLFLSGGIILYEGNYGNTGWNLSDRKDGGIHSLPDKHGLHCPKRQGTAMTSQPPMHPNAPPRMKAGFVDAHNLPRTCRLAHRSLAKPQKSGFDFAVSERHNYFHNQHNKMEEKK